VNDCVVFSISSLMRMRSLSDIVFSLFVEVSLKNGTAGYDSSGPNVQEIPDYDPSRGGFDHARRSEGLLHLGQGAEGFKLLGQEVHAYQLVCELVAVGADRIESVGLELEG